MPFSVKRIRTGQPNTGTSLFRFLTGTSHARFDWTLTQRSRICVPFTQQQKHIQERARPQSSHERLRFHANTGRLGLCAFLGLVLSFGSFPFRELFLSSRTPKGHNAGRWAASAF
jgi:hypothetical protein